MRKGNAENALDAATGASMTIRILVTGSREWDDRDAIKSALCAAMVQLTKPGDTVVVVHGDCPTGADSIAKEEAIWLERNSRWVSPISVTHEPHPADWNTHGKAAGPIRNQQMVDLGADLCLAFPTAKSVGTWDCIKRANRAGIPVKVIPERNR